MKRPKNPTKVIKGTGILGGNGECSCLFVEEDTVEIIDGNRKEKLPKRMYHDPSLCFDDIFPTPYKSDQDLDRGDRFRFKIEVEVEVLK